MSSQVESAQSMLDVNITSVKDAEVGADYRTMLQIVASQFLEHRMAVISSGVILFFILVALMAPLTAYFTGLDPTTQNVFERYQPPMTRNSLSADDRITAFEKWASEHPAHQDALYQSLLSQGKIAAEQPDHTEAINQWIEGSTAKQMLEALGKATPEVKAELVPIVNNFETLHILGTDELGRDVFIRLVYGTRVSVGVGILVAVASALMGLIVGSIAGFYGGVIDTVLMRITDSLLSLPIMPVMIIFAAADLTKVPGLNLLLTSNSESIMKLVIVVCLFSWMTVARLVRGSILSLREREFVLAAKTLGAKDSTLILTHMLPNVLAPLLVTVTVNVGQSIIYEASLSFLGLGIQPPTPSWGNMLSNAQELITQAPSLAVVPALLIFVTVISFNFVGDGLQSAIDPKSVKR